REPYTARALSALFYRRNIRFPRIRLLACLPLVRGRVCREPGLRSTFAEPARQSRARRGGGGRCCRGCLRLCRASLSQLINGEDPMTRIITFTVFGLYLLTSTAVSAAERTVTLAVKNMYCAAWKSLEAVPGVTKVVVSYQDKTAVVTYDDTRTEVKVLTSATTNAG